MSPGWLLLLPLLYVAVLFAVAYFGDRKLEPMVHRSRWRPVVYSLALAVYCSSWTFYGAVGTAARTGWGYLPIYLGPALLFVFGYPFLRRMARVVRQRRITSIADFIGARFGQSHGLAALVAAIAVVAIVPYVALQLKAVAMTFDVLLDANGGGRIIDTALWCALLLAAFAILFSTRTADATEHHRGMVLAIALESLVKLMVFLALAAYALWHGPGLVATAKVPLLQWSETVPQGFVAQTVLAFCAMFCLPRQFYIGLVESSDHDDLRRARWLLPLYMVLISIAVVPIVVTGSGIPGLDPADADTWLLSLPLALGDHGMAVLAFVGGFSAATGMVIVALVALSIMISNDLVMPALLRIPRLQLGQYEDLSRWVLLIRRVAIVTVALLAYVYYRTADDAQSLAATGLLAFAAVIQFAPALLAALYWRNASWRGVVAGLTGGFGVWVYTLLLPALFDDARWIATGPFGLAWLEPHALFYLDGWGPVMHGTFWSLLFNIGALVFFSLRYRPSLEARLYADTFIDSDGEQPAHGDWRGRVKVADLKVIAERIVGRRNSIKAFREHAKVVGRHFDADDAADRRLIQFTERLLASVVGAANARRILTGALSGSGLDVAESLALLDETSQELRFNRELLSTTLENVAQGISMIDADMRLVAWNRRYLELFNYPDGMVRVGVQVGELIRWNAERGECGPGVVEEHVAKRIEYMKAGSPHLFERVRSDGTVIEIRGRPVKGGGYVTTYSDVTAYKRVEQALLATNETLEKRVASRTAELSRALDVADDAKRVAEAANISKTRFLAAASHDLLQPLNAARLFTTALCTHDGLDPEAERLAQRIDAAFHSAEDLLGTLLDMSRLDAGSYHPEVTDFALGDLFGSLEAQFNVVASRRHLRFRVMTTRLAVHSDPQLLRRIIQNLVSNALRYTSSGGVYLGAQRRGDTIRVCVWDTGPGIAPEQRQRIFGEFQRLDQESPWGEKGLGLGLSICDRLAGILEHRLTVYSRVGHGSCFAIDVPRSRRVPSRSAGPVMAAPTRQLPLTVACLDDDAGTQDGMRTLLDRWGVRCHVAADVNGMEQVLRDQAVDVLLTDYHLIDGSNGLDALEQLRARLGVLPPAVMITADGSTRLKNQVQERGMTILHKPVRPAALRAVLTAFASRPSSGNGQVDVGKPVSQEVDAAGP